MARVLSGVTAAILAGGLGTRLRSVVADRPKVLAQVGARPFLTYLLERLARAGVQKTVLLVGYGADQVRSAFGDEYNGMAIAYSTEPEPLGTGGAVRLSLPFFHDQSVLLLNGDSFCDVDLVRFYDHQQRFPGTTGLVLARVEDTSRYGRVRVEADGRVVRFEEKGQDPTPGWINAGVYLVPRSAIAEIPSDRPVSLEREVLPHWVESPGLRGFQGGRFIDIGTPESYAEAEAFFHPTESNGTRSSDT